MYQTMYIHTNVYALIKYPDTKPLVIGSCEYIMELADLLEVLKED